MSNDTEISKDVLDQQEYLMRYTIIFYVHYLKNQGIVDDPDPFFLAGKEYMDRLRLVLDKFNEHGIEVEDQGFKRESLVTIVRLSTQSYKDGTAHCFVCDDVLGNHGQAINICKICGGMICLPAETYEQDG